MEKSKEIKTLDDVVLESAAKQSSQYISDYYNRLVGEGRLELFLRLLSTASSQTMSKAKACKFISENMKGFFRGDNGVLTTDTLEKMIERYPDVNKAWIVHRNTIAGLAMSKLANLIDDIKDPVVLLSIIERLDSEGKFISKKNSDDYIPTKRTVNINIDKSGKAINEDTDEDENELSTLTQIQRSLELLSKKNENAESGGDEDGGTE